MVEMVLAGGWTRAKLAARTADERHTIWKNARTKGTPEALALAKAIEDLGLPYSDPACLRMDDPVTIRMHEIINSPVGRDACLTATANGLPAIAGVDEMLNQALGVDYQKGNMATATAGGLIADLMRSLGFEKAGQKSTPSGCVARSGVVWVGRRRG